MAYPELYLNLNYNQKVFFAVIIVITVLLISIISKMKNKRVKSERQQINHIRIDLRKIVANYDKFIEENTKNMYLFEKKEFIAKVNSELCSMILKGVR